MAKYSKLYKKFWNNRIIRSLQDEEKLLYLYFLSNPHTNAIGLYPIHFNYIGADLEWPAEKVSKRYSKLYRKRLVQYFENVRVIYIPSWFEHNPIQNPNHLKHCIEHLSEIPMTQEIKTAFRAGLVYLPPKYAESFNIALSETVTHTVCQTLWDTVSKHKDLDLDLDRDLNKDIKEPTAKILEDIVTLWNEITKPPIPKIKTLTADRRRKLNARLKEYDVSTFKEVFRKITKSPFLCGKNDKSWVATFDWLIKNQRTITAVLEGNYHRDSGEAQGKPPAHDEYKEGSNDDRKVEPKKVLAGIKELSKKLSAENATSVSENAAAEREGSS